MSSFSAFSKFALTVCLLLAAQLSSWATHLRAGEITATRIGCSLEFRICLNIYVNTSQDAVDFGGGTLRFGDGERHITSTVSKAETDPVPGASNVGKIEYCINYTYQALGPYKISYMELNRNRDIRNITGSVNVNFYLETWIEIDPFKGCDNSPRLLVPPIDNVCVGSRWQHNPGAYDPDGDSLSYQLVTPKHLPNPDIYQPDVVPGYNDPNNQAYYTGVDYNNAQQDGTGRPTFDIDPITGTITWDAPGTSGEYNIAFLVIEWRKVNDVWLQIGYITRDMQILVEDCDDLPPIVTGPTEICVQAGDVVSAVFEGTDPENRSVLMEIFSETLRLDVSPATFTPPLNPDGTPVSQSTSPLPATVTFTWQTDCAHIKQQPYLVVVKITDLPKRQAAFHTLRVTVVGPPPEWNTATISPNRSVSLDWKAYDCASKADSMQIWRRIDSMDYTREECVTGMPSGLGYKKIKTVAIGQHDFLDTNNNKGLPPGAVVCYRLVASFPPPNDNTEGGSESYVSDEICVGPILADAPVMTNVTIDTTNRDKGEITVRWTPPFDLNPGDFPPPYTYEVYRAVGFSGNTDIALVKTIKWPTGVVGDTVIVDSLLNTTDNVYNYRVVVYDNTNTKIDTSAIASTVRLLAKSLPEKIELTWTADVPWSLQSSISPLHYIYRGAEGDLEGDFQLIGTVPSTQDILRFTDVGLQENQKYCYRVETHGGYGFDDPSKIPEPLVNFSQIVCAQPSDLKPPCQPELLVDVLDCEEYYALYGCDFNDFSNVLRWPRPKEDECRDDISHYRIYYSNSANADTTEYQLLVDLEDRPLDTVYVDRNLPSFARCYRLKAVDRSGNESKFSEPACNDNCPNYQLPNVFTPGNGDDCNDFFSAYSDRNIINGIMQCTDVQAPAEVLADIRQVCPRFVLKVEVVIVDRWGKPVYSYSSGGENSIFIDWDGRDHNGKELSSGVYFYSARVTFEALKPEDREKVIKGWVQLVRPD